MSRIGFAITGSFCNHLEVIEILKQFKENDYKIVPFFTPTVMTTDTRFGEVATFKLAVEEVCNHKIIDELVVAESFGPANFIDCFVIAPCTATSLSKLAHGIYDNAPLLAAKATLRNNIPVVVAPSSNDLLGISGVNLMQVINMKNIYVVPFHQDDPINKPKSLVADFAKTFATVELALQGKQIQPIMY